MASLRQAAACLGFSGNISIAHDLLGFFRGQLPPDPQKPVDGSRTVISLAQQIQLLRAAKSHNPDLQQRHFNINVIRVGSEFFSEGQFQQIDYSIYRLRTIYGQRGIGVGRVQHWDVSVADAMGFHALTTREQAEEISDHWTIPNDGIDVFIPITMNIPEGAGILLGLSPPGEVQEGKGGPCPGDKNGELTGTVVGLFGSEQTSRTFAHEAGHYLGLRHREDPANLMCQSGAATSIRNSVLLDGLQAFFVVANCMSHVGCDL